MLLLCLAGIALQSLFQHRESEARLHLLNDGLIPTALTIGEGRGTQTLFGAMLERVSKSSESVEASSDEAGLRTWMIAARRVRPTTIDRAIRGAQRGISLASTPTDADELREIKRELEVARGLFLENEVRHDRVFGADSRDRSELDELIRVETEADRHLRRAGARLQRVIGKTASAAEAEQRRAIVWLSSLTVLALAAGVFVTLWSRRALAPLVPLQQRVEAITRGESPPARLEPLRDDEIGRLTSAFQNMLDALRARDARLQEASQSLLESERLAAVGRMAAHVTHEIRNPLSSIGLNLELLEEEPSSPSEESRRLLASIHKEVLRLESLTEDYLRLSRLPRPELENEDIAALVNDVVSFLKPELNAKSISIEHASFAPRVDVRMDASQIRGVLVNLIRNAREAIGENGTVEVRIESPSAERIELSVHDSGPGIPQDQLARVFEVFFTTKSGGTGLGLAFAQQVIVAHEGTLSVSSDVGRGATFTITLPRS